MHEQARHLLQQVEADIAANRLILPSLPEVALRVRELSGNYNCTATTLAHEISKDAGIAARLLKVANSSAIQRGAPVKSLQQAILTLGFSLVRSLVTQLAILQTMQTGYNTKRLQGFVASSLQISTLCYGLASKHRHLDSELAALAGLLHDIGKLPLRNFLEQQKQLTAVERLDYEQMLHPEVGAMMLKRWQMSDELVQVASQHENMRRESGKAMPDYVDIVIAANLLHYGFEEGRYVYLQGERIPALIKSAGATQRLADLHSTQERMNLALALIGA